MGMSTHVIGIKPPDDKWLKMKAAWDACQDAGIDPPAEILEYFEDERPDPAGVKVEVPVRAWKNTYAEGFEIDVDKLSPDVKIVRFYNAW